MSYLDFTCGFQFCMRAHQNTSANTGGVGEGLSRNMYEGQMDKAKGGGRQGWVGRGGAWWAENGGNCT